MISNKKNGLSVSLVATRVMPSLLPQTMNPSLSLEQFSNLLEVLQEMLELIDRLFINHLQYSYFHWIWQGICGQPSALQSLEYFNFILFIRHQRKKLKLDHLSLASPERLRTLRHQHSTDNMHTPSFNIPFVKVEQRKTCSEENMIKTHSSSKPIH